MKVMTAGAGSMIIDGDRHMLGVRLDNPLQSFFHKTWRPAAIEPI